MKRRLLYIIAFILLLSSTNLVAQSIEPPLEINQTDELGDRQGWWHQYRKEVTHIAYYIDDIIKFEYKTQNGQILLFNDHLSQFTTYDFEPDMYLVSSCEDIERRGLGAANKDNNHWAGQGGSKWRLREYHPDGSRRYEALCLYNLDATNHNHDNYQSKESSMYYDYDGEEIIGFNQISFRDSIPTINYMSAEGLREGWWSQRDEQGRTTVECYRHGKLINLRYATSADLLPIYFERIDDSGQVAVRYNFDKYGLLSGVMMDFNHSGSAVSCYYIELHEDGKRKSEGRWQYTDNPLDGRRYGE